MDINVIYTAKDGRRFNDPYECEEYEKRLGTEPGRVGRARINLKPGHECYAYDIQPCKTWGSLISQIVKVFQSEYNASDDDSVSDIKEYIIEDVRITANGGAFVGIGH